MEELNKKRLYSLISIIIQCFIYGITMHCISKVSIACMIIYTIFVVLSLAREIFLLVKLFLKK